MMTVKELIEKLEKFDPSMEVVVGMIQRYGSDFAMEISDVSINTVDDWDYGDCERVVITEGNQIGSVDYDYDIDEDDY